MLAASSLNREEGKVPASQGQVAGPRAPGIPAGLLPVTFLLGPEREQGRSRPQESPIRGAGWYDSTHRCAPYPVAVWLDLATTHVPHPGPMPPPLVRSMLRRGLGGIHSQDMISQMMDHPAAAHLGAQPPRYLNLPRPLPVIIFQPVKGVLNP